jgi:arabinan endo-1,5-alpha-L-arabinosidase
MSIKARIVRLAIPVVLVATLLVIAIVHGGGGEEPATDAQSVESVESVDLPAAQAAPVIPAPAATEAATPPRPVVDPTGQAAVGDASLAPVARGAPLSGALANVHDPTIVRAGNAWYVFSTGDGIPIRRSTDLGRWDVVGEVFPFGLPTWIAEHVPGIDPTSRVLWAPDISYANGRWYLYYSVGEFGTQDAVIGVATNTTLNPQEPGYQWVDQGMVLASDGNDATMAIDPAAVTSPDGSRWLVYGSFWQGIFIRKVDASGKFAAGSSAHNLARRSSGGIEAGSLVYRDGWWWLFSSVGKCCKALNSNYSIVVGRSRDVAGPYVDASGRDLLDGGGTTVTGSFGNMVGPGHGTVIQDGERWVLAHHYYDRNNGGTPTLKVRPVVWAADGWPIAPDTGFAPSAPASPLDAVGVWNVSGYPEERSDRRFDAMSIELRPDGTVSPSGTWSVAGDRVVVHGVSTPSGVRDVWWVLDYGAGSGFGRDDRTAAIRATR